MMEKEDNTSSVKEKEEITFIVKEEEEISSIVKEDNEITSVVKDEEEFTGIVKEEEGNTSVVNEEEDIKYFVKEEEQMIGVVKDEEEMTGIVKEEENITSVVKKQGHATGNVKESAEITNIGKGKEDITNIEQDETRVTSLGKKDGEDEGNMKVDEEITTIRNEEDEIISVVTERDVVDGSRKGKENVSSTSVNEVESDVSTDARSSRFCPLAALYRPAHQVVVPVPEAPLYNNLQQFLAAQEKGDGRTVLPVGSKEEVEKLREERERAKRQREAELEEKNRRRFTEKQALTKVPRRVRAPRDLLTRCEKTVGPLATLKECMENRIRVRVLTRHATGLRGQLIGYVEAFDKQWNLAMSEVLEIWKRKSVTKRKVPPAMGTPCPRGTAAKLAPIPEVTETPIGHNMVECTRILPQLLVRGEHVVLVQIIER